MTALADVALGSLQMGFTFHLRTQNGTGTCFLYGKEEGFFFVSAAHLLKGVQPNDQIYLAYSGDWKSWAVTAVFRPDSDHDIVAFVTGQPIGGEPEFDSSFGVMPGQPMKFLGFPHGLSSNYPSDFGYHTPMVRTAQFSGIINHNGTVLTVLDGFNNPGYSGGPIYCCGSDGKPKLFGVISGYRFKLESHSLVYRKNESGDFEPLPDLMVKMNSGMIYATGKGDYEPLFASVNVFQPTVNLE